MVFSFIKRSKYMKFYFILSLHFLTFSSCQEQKTVEVVHKEFDGIPIIRLDREVISGIGLNPVQNKDQPDRRLFQKRLVRGADLSVYVVSSETATAQQDNYGVEEFIKLINGRSRMNPVNGDEAIFETGDSFIAPKGFTGEWQTIGGDEFLIELSIISTQRIEGDIFNHKTVPYLIDKKLRSGVSLDKNNGKLNSEDSHEVYRGIELTIKVITHKPKEVILTEPMQEQVVEVLSGKISVTPTGGKTETFISGDYYMVPKGFVGTFKYEGHGVARTMNIYKSDVEK